MKKTEKQMWVCECCGSIHVQTKVWVDLNSSAIDWDGSADMEEHFCQDCEHTGVELRVIPTTNGAVKILGYQVQDIDGNLHPDMTNDLSLYSLDQADDMIMSDADGVDCIEWYLKAKYKGDIENPVKMFNSKNA